MRLSALLKVRSVVVAHGRTLEHGTAAAGLALTLGVSLLAGASGCRENDFTEEPGNGGQLGKQPGTTGGSGGTGGASGSAGTAGTSGTAGTAGASGSGGGNPVDVKIQTYNVAMAGAFIPFAAERRAALPATIAGLDADIVCIQEAWDESDKLAIQAALAPGQTAVWFKHDDDTVVTDTDDALGNPVAPFTTPPCADAVTQLNTALDCVAAHCSTVAGSDQGYTTSTSCVTSSCIAQAAGLLSKQRCYGCLAPSLPTEKIADIRTRCNDTSIPNPLSFRGQSGTMIITRFPVVGAPIDHVLPAAWNRRNVIGATVTIPNGSDIDVYCTHLTPIFRGGTLPYTGQYGANEDGTSAVGAQAWENEQYLQAKKLIDFAAERSGDKRALIIGDMNSGEPAKPGSMHPQLFDEGSRTIDRFSAVYTHALASGYDPGCTFCPPPGDPNTDMDLTNPLVSAGEHAVYIDHVFLKGMDASHVKTSTRNLTDFDVIVSGAPGMVPHSDHFGYATTVSIE